MRYLRRPRVLAVAAIVLVGTVIRVQAAAEGSPAPLPDSRFYVQLADALYEDGTFDTPKIERPTSFAPGTPLLAAGVYFAAGSEDKAAARIVVALLGGATVLLAFLIGERLGGSWAALVAAALVAGYPALIDYHRMLMTEPLAAFLLAASVWALLRALDPGRGWPSWTGAGVLFGLAALARAELLAVGLLLVVVAGLLVVRRREWRQGLALAGAAAAGVVLAVAPWTIHNAVAHDRFLPVADGAGKALFIGTYVPAYDRGFSDPDFRVLHRMRLEYPWLDRETASLYPNSPHRLPAGRNLAAVGARLYPGLRDDQVGAKLGRQNLDRYAWGDPTGFAGFLARKEAFVWSHGATDAMNAVGWRILHLALVALALVGLILLALRRRPEAAILGTLFVAALLLAAFTQPTPRRNLALVPELAALAGFAVAEGARRVGPSRSQLR